MKHLDSCPGVNSFQRERPAGMPLFSAEIMSYA
jgi:hypothetical protein